MKTFVPVLIVFFFTSVGTAQMKGGMQPMRPGAPVFGGPKLQKSYADSTEFKKQFKELYPILKVNPTPRERAERIFFQQSRMFRQRGIDSAKAYDSVMKSIDPSMDEKILFDAYRAEFTAEELKSIVQFFKSPVGKHYLEVEPRLASARSSEIELEISRTVNRTLSTMGKPMETPPGMHPGMQSRFPLPSHPKPATPPPPPSAPQPNPAPQQPNPAPTKE